MSNESREDSFRQDVVRSVVGAADEDETDKTEADNEEVFHDPSIALRVASLARTFSHLVWVLTALLIIIRLVSDWRQVPDLASLQPQVIFSELYSVISLVISGGLYFIILQAVSQIVYLLMDVERDSFLARRRVG